MTLLPFSDAHQGFDFLISLFCGGRVLFLRFLREKQNPSNLEWTDRVYSSCPVSIGLDEITLFRENARLEKDRSWRL
ncbi:MAG: hypothetical protein AAGJ35_14905 [Myxococcota bacterium]